MLYDSHAHLDDEKLYPEIDAVLSRAQEAGVQYINTIGCDWKSSLMAVRIAEKYAQHDVHIFAAAGVHPHQADEYDETLSERLFELAQSERCVAWGEIGLDYHYDNSPRDQQRNVFTSQIDAAHQAGLPIVIHDRDAHQDTLDILRRERGKLTNGGVLHCFSGSWELARDCMRLGLYISFAGPLTFSNARTALEVAAQVPSDLLLVETDCPYLAPEPQRGHRNEPACVRYTAAKLAEVRGISLDELAALTTANACRLFRTGERRA